MRTVLCLLGALIVTTAIGTPAHAQNYPWCAYYSGRALGGATNCGFTTFQQCLATVSGIGGFCEPKYAIPPTARTAPALPRLSILKRDGLKSNRNRSPPLVPAHAGTQFLPNNQSYFQLHLDSRFRGNERT